MEPEYKQKNEYPDLYNILGLSIKICEDPNCDEIIRKAYIKKAKVCHPDKHPGREDVAEVFELLTRSYEILKNEKQRTAYNHKLSIVRKSYNDFLKLRKEYSDYSQTTGEYVPVTDKQKISFDDQMKMFDLKQGFDRDKVGFIDSSEAKRKMNDISKSRAEQDNILKPDKLFDDGRFDLKKFNAAFDVVHTRNDNAMITHNEIPSAWNYLGNCTGYSCFDNLDNMFVDDATRCDISNQTYGSVDFCSPFGKITKDDILNISDADYVDGHNDLGNDYYRDLKSKLNNRKTEEKNFENMKISDFKTDYTAGYGIFDNIGMKYNDMLSLDIDDDDISEKIEKIIGEKQQDLHYPENYHRSTKAQNYNNFVGR